MNMNIDNKVSFKSNIRFVDGVEFFRHTSKPYFTCAPSGYHLSESMVRGEDLFTPTVRTCTAGGVVDKDGVVGFHFIDCKDNIFKINKFLKNILAANLSEPTSALIIGSKNHPACPYSTGVFEHTESNVRDIVQPSVFKSYKSLFGESDIAYEKDSDTWFINSRVGEDTESGGVEFYEIDTLSRLKKSFERIFISPNDKLYIGDELISL